MGEKTEGFKKFASGIASKVGAEASKVGDAAVKKAGEVIGEAGTETIKSIGHSIAETGNKAVDKLTETFADSELVKKTEKFASDAVDTGQKMLDDLNQMRDQIEKDGFSETAMNTTKKVVSTVSTLPLVRVDREDFLRKTFGKSKYIDQIIELGPQAVFSIDALREKAAEIIDASTRKTSVVSFVSGLPSNVLAMFAAGTADLTQFFGFALNMAQKIAYLFGEDQLFIDATQVGHVITGTDDFVDKNGVVLPEESQIRLISYLGAMMGVGGAGALILKTSQRAGVNIGRKVAATALTKTAWYPLMKKTGSILGYKITKKTVESALSKAVPIAGGVISGGITYLTFRPMGNKLADEFVKISNGEYDQELELNPEFAKSIGLAADLDAEFIDIVPIENDTEE